MGGEAREDRGKGCQRERDGYAAGDGGEALAYRVGDGSQGLERAWAAAGATGGGRQVLADAYGHGQQGKRIGWIPDDRYTQPRDDADGCGRAASVGDAYGERKRQPDYAAERDRWPGPRGDARGTDGRLAQSRVGGASHGLPAGMDRWPAGPAEAQHDWEAPRTAKDITNRAARLKALGNAVVPQVAREVGRWMIAAGLFDQVEVA